MNFDGNIVDRRVGVLLETVHDRADQNHGADADHDTDDGHQAAELVRTYGIQRQPNALLDLRNRSLPVTHNSVQ